MNKATLLKILNPLLFLSAIIQLCSILVRLASYTAWSQEIHEINGWILLALILLHLILNWNWVRSVLLAKKKKPS